MEGGGGGVGVGGGGGGWGRAGLKSSKDGGLAGFGVFKRLHIVQQR